MLDILCLFTHIQCVHCRLGMGLLNALALTEHDHIGTVVADWDHWVALLPHSSRLLGSMHGSRSLRFFHWFLKVV